jgi:membrane protein DedA with SNARE-associated domain
LTDIIGVVEGFFNNLPHFMENVEGFLQAHAYQPYFVYASVVFSMILSAFGVPIPEEVTLISAGLVAFMARHPELYPPPANAPALKVNAYLLAGICFVSVVGADYLIYWLGQNFGRRLLVSRRFRKVIKPSMIRKVRAAVKKHGAMASAIFRFTPGVRFPGHLVCGMMRLPAWKFVLVDAIAALISVPTQVLLIAFYGDTILHYLKTFKFVLLSAIALGLLYLLIRKLTRRKPVFSAEN